MDECSETSEVDASSPDLLVQLYDEFEDNRAEFLLAQLLC